MTYAIDNEALITIVVSNGTQSMTLVDGQLMGAGDHNEGVEWRGQSASDPTGKQFDFDKEGNYTVSIQAVNPVTGSSSVRSGNIKVQY